VRIASQRLPKSPVRIFVPFLHSMVNFSSPLESAIYKSLCMPGRFGRLLFSWIYKSLSSQLPCFQIHAKRPCVTPLRLPWAVLASSRVPLLCRKSNSFNRLPALILSCRSFSQSLPLFSMPCGLFLQNTGGWVPLALLSHRVPSAEGSSIRYSPKWSIIPAPDSPARLRGRSV
jgi:hypothetical protein